MTYRKIYGTKNFIAQYYSYYTLQYWEFTRKNFETRVKKKKL